jgi:hypothetical protein
MVDGKDWERVGFRWVSPVSSVVKVFRRYLRP